MPNSIEEEDPFEPRGHAQQRIRTTATGNKRCGRKTALDHWSWSVCAMGLMRTSAIDVASARNHGTNWFFCGAVKLCYVMRWCVTEPWIMIKQFWLRHDMGRRMEVRGITMSSPFSRRVTTETLENAPHITHNNAHVRAHTANLRLWNEWLQQKTNKNCTDGQTLSVARTNW